MVMMLSYKNGVNLIEQMSEIAEKLKLLGDKTRLTMLTLLKQKEWCVCEFVDILTCLSQRLAST